MLQPPSLVNFRGAMIYRWIKQIIRNSQTAKVKIIDTETFFETHKEENPYIILGLGDASSSSANFLGEFSKMPNSPFEVYLIQDSQAKKVFRSQGLSGSKFNIIFLNNPAKILKEYSEDLDYHLFYQWLLQQASKPGAFGFGNNINYVKKNFLLNKPTFAFFGAKNAKEFSKQKFVKSIRRVAERSEADVLWGNPTSEYLDEVDYVDCSEKDYSNGQICGYYYVDFSNKNASRRYKVSVGKFDEDSLEVALKRFLGGIKNTMPYKFSDASKLDVLGSNSFIKPLSLKTLDVLKNSKKDSIILSFNVCGSNCQDKLKLILGLEQTLSKQSLSSINFYTLNLKKNELPNQFYEFSQLNLLYVRSTSPDKHIPLNNISSVSDLVSAIKKHSTTEILDVSEMDKDLEDYI